MTYKQARAEILRQAELSGQTPTPAELREAADYVVKLWRQQKAATVTAAEPNPEPEPAAKE